MKKNQCKDALDIYKKFLYRMTKLSEFLKVAEVLFLFVINKHVDGEDCAVLQSFLVNESSDTSLTTAHAAIKGC